MILECKGTGSKNCAHYKLRRKSVQKGAGAIPDFPEIAQRIDLEFYCGEKLLRNVSGRVMTEKLVRQRARTSALNCAFKAVIETHRLMNGGTNCDRLKKAY